MQACDRVASQEYEDVVKLLLDRDADPTARDDKGETPISCQLGPETGKMWPT
jgi:ankyrin repeat protein